MGDKSPKSKRKNQGQKQNKSDAVKKEKERMIDSKKIVAVPPKKNSN